MPPLRPRKPGCKNTFVILFLLVRFDLKGIPPDVGVASGAKFDLSKILNVPSFPCRCRAIIVPLSLRCVPSFPAPHVSIRPDKGSLSNHKQNVPGKRCRARQNRWGGRDDPTLLLPLRRPG